MASSIPTDVRTTAFHAEAARTVDRVPYPLALAGSSLFILLCTRMLLPHVGIHGLEGVFVCYAVVGLSMPVIGLAAALRARCYPFASTSDPMQVLPTIFALIAGAVYVAAQHSFLPVLAAAVGALTFWLTARLAPDAARTATRFRTLLYFAITAICSAAAMILVWPNGLTTIASSFPHSVPRWFGMAAATIAPLIGIGAATRAFAIVGGLTRRAIIAERSVDIFFAIVAICFAFSSYSLKWWVAAHHWGVYVRPAQMVRDGGWLMWDVPSQYGFGSVAAIAALPFASVWTCLHVLMGTLQAAAALLIYATLSRALGSGPFQRLLACIVVFGAMFLLPGFPQSHMGQEVFPSIGAMRFFMPYALIGLLVWEFRAPEGSRDIRASWTLAGGSLLWLAGIAWSPETGFYSTAIWAPAMAFLLIRLAKSRRTPPAKIAGWTLLPAGLLAVLVVGIQATYVHGLGHGPDWRAYIDYVIAAGVGVFAAPLNAYGSFWVLFFALAACIAALSICVYRDGIESHGAALGAGSAMLVWLTASYFVGRSTEYNVINLAPAFCLAIAAVLLTLRSPHIDHTLSMPMKAFAAALYGTIVGAVILFSVTQPRWFIAHARVPRFDVRSRFEAPRAATKTLLARAGIRRGDRVAYLYMTTFSPGSSDTVSTIVDNAPRLLPLDPLALDESLPHDRVITYLDRYYARHQSAGWLILPPTLPSEESYRLELEPWLSGHYDIVRRISDGQTVVLRVTPRKPGSAKQSPSMWSDLKGVPEVD